MDMKVSNKKLLGSPVAAILDDRDKALVTAMQTGLPMSTTPYADLAQTVHMDEDEVIRRIRRLQDDGVIKRFGIVVRHRELGYKANAMAVWNIPDERVNELGQCIGRFEFITLCYRRPRHLPQWPYNLFTMIHGKSRADVMDNLNTLISQCKLQDIEYDVLFSTRRFKQRGAIYRHIPGKVCEQS